MLLLNVIFTIILLQTCSYVSSRECSNCQLITSCQPLLFLINYKRDDETANRIIQAHCGYDEAKKEHMVCCSDFKSIKSESRIGAVQDKTSLLPESCGDIDGYRIVGGNVAGLYEFPWMALISYNDTTGIDFKCSGSIINSRYILTAAHCIQDTIIGVRVGEHDISTSEDCYQNMCETHIQDIPIDKITTHPKWNFQKRINDIALIRVAEEINLTPANVQPICLPLNPNLQNEDLIGKNAVVSGWGLIETSEASTVLLKVTVPIVVCVNKTRTQICAGERFRDSCRGDSGGPLMLEDEYGDTMRFVQFGIVSYGTRFKCGSSTPGTYTDVRKYVDWILETIEP